MPDDTVKVESSNAPLSLFDQLKNSVSHNVITNTGSHLIATPHTNNNNDISDNNNSVTCSVESKSKTNIDACTRSVHTDGKMPIATTTIIGAFQQLTAKDDQDNRIVSTKANVTTSITTTTTATVAEKDVKDINNECKNASGKSIKGNVVATEQQRIVAFCLRQQDDINENGNANANANSNVVGKNSTDNCKDTITHLATSLSGCSSLSSLSVTSGLDNANKDNRKDDNKKTSRAEMQTTTMTSLSLSSPPMPLLAAKAMRMEQMQKDNNNFANISNATTLSLSQSCSTATAATVATNLQSTITATKTTTTIATTAIATETNITLPANKSATIVNANLMASANKAKGDAVAQQINGDSNKQVVASVNTTAQSVEGVECKTPATTITITNINNCNDNSNNNINTTFSGGGSGSGNGKITITSPDERKHQLFSAPSLPPPAAPTSFPVNNNGNANKNKRSSCSANGKGGDIVTATNTTALTSSGSSIGIVHGTKRSTNPFAIVSSASVTSPTATTTTTNATRTSAATTTTFTTPANVLHQQQQQLYNNTQQQHTFELPTNLYDNVHPNAGNSGQCNGINMISSLASTATSQHKFDVAIRSQLRQPGHHYQHINHHNHHHHHNLFGSTLSNRIIGNNNLIKKTATAAGLSRNTEGNDDASKKKRCTDRYDSSESSDSGVATSLSCTDSNTGSCEDASEPGSPYSPQSHLGDDHPVIPSANSHVCTRKMPPHTILATPANAASSGSGSSASTNTSSTATHTIVPTIINSNSNSNSNNSNSQPNTAKLKQTQTPSLKSLATTVSSPSSRSTPPTLQWPWNTQAATNSSTNGGQTKKRVSLNGNSDGATKSKRTATVPNSAAIQDTTASATGLVSGTGTTASSNGTSNGSGATALKRLKAAAMEESQTKITGYFKSQMKAQIHQNGSGGKRTDILGPATSTSSSNMTANPLTLSAPNTTASLNKYFNILAQLEKGKENNGRDLKCGFMPAVVSGAPTSLLVPPIIATSANSIAISATATTTTATTSLPSATTLPFQAPASASASSTTSVTTTTPSLTLTPAVIPAIVPPTPAPAIAPAAVPAPAPMPIPALKKIERSKPTKIAQVAPNLRKTPANGNFGGAGATKSPPKKHVAIAPRTPEMKQQQQQQQAAKVDANKHVAASPTPPQMPATTQQPAVLLTAIRLPPQAAPAPQATTNQLKSAVATQKLAPNSATPQPGTATAPPPNPTLYQLPVQLPNLVQQAAAAQYFLNGTVFKLQQYTTATTTTATSAVATGAGTPANPFNLMNAADLQEMLFKQQQQQQKATANSYQEIFQQQIAAAIAANQQQTQQQFQQQQFQQLQRLGAATANIQQPVFMATPTGFLLNATSLPAMLAQALTVNNGQQQQQPKPVTLQQPQQLPALQPIQTNPLPALSSIFAQHHQQQQQHQQQQHQQQQQEQNDLQQQQFQQQQQLAQLALAQQQQQQQQQQFITASQPPPLSAVTLTSNGSGGAIATTQQPQLAAPIMATPSVPPAAAPATPKLAIVKASSAPQFPALNSQPPPLVTISNAKSRAQLPLSSPSLAGSVLIKPSALTKPYQKRGPKAATPPAAAQSKSGIPSSKTKITAGGKIIASPTTPPPLVPTTLSSAAKELSSLRANVPPTKSGKPVLSLPTPALVSIAASKPLPSKPTASLAPSPSAAAAGSAAVTMSVKTEQFHQQKEQVATKVPNSGSSAVTATSTSDLFDLIKNSNGAISIAAPTNFSSNSCLSSSTSDSFAKIKDEPMDDAALMSFESEVKREMPTSFSGHLLVPMKVEDELREDTLKICESLPPSSHLNHECSSSSFSSSSNSVSSAADLSLEASTPASLTSSSCSAAPSPAPSMLASVASPRNSPRRSPPLPTPQSSFDSNFSNSCATSTSSSSSACRASSHDMLSELVTSSCISSGASVSNMSMSTARDSPHKPEEHMDAAPDDKRDLPTPESGIGGSLSNSESGSSVSAISNSTSKSDEALLDADNQISNDSNSPPPTPLAGSSSSNSSDSIASNAPSPASPNDMALSESSNASVAVPSPVDESSSTSSPTTTLMETLSTETATSSQSCAISPILTQPKTIRFPAESIHRHGPKGAKRHDGVCYWDKCNKKHESSSKLLDHMQTQHVNTQTGPFSCLWVGCKVYNKKSCSRRWLERHVLSHGGSKQLKCIVEGCGLRFASQLTLEKHVNSHFNATEAKESTNKRTSDPPVPKQLRKNGKKLRYRRQPFSARMFDFFDAGIMEGLQHRLRQIHTLTGGSNGSITFRGRSTMRRTTFDGKIENFVRWWPQDIISDEWLPESEETYSKTVVIRHMKPMEKIRVDMLLTASYRRPFEPNLFGNNWDAMEANESASETDQEEEEEEDEEEDSEEEESGVEDEDESESASDEESDAETEAENCTSSTEMMAVTSTIQQLITIANLEMQPRQKHPRKPQKRIAPTF